MACRALLPWRPRQDWLVGQGRSLSRAAPPSGCWRGSGEAGQPVRSPRSSWVSRAVTCMLTCAPGAQPPSNPVPSGVAATPPRGVRLWACGAGCAGDSPVGRPGGCCPCPCPGLSQAALLTPACPSLTLLPSSCPKGRPWHTHSHSPLVLSQPGSQGRGHLSLGGVGGPTEPLCLWDLPGWCLPRWALFSQRDGLQGDLSWAMWSQHRVKLLRARQPTFDQPCAFPSATPGTPPSRKPSGLSTLALSTELRGRIMTGPDIPSD